MSKPSSPTKKMSAKQRGKQAEPPAPATVTTTAAPTKKPKPEKSKTRRLHVAGLPAISEEDVFDRFKSFGKVEKVDGLGKLDGNGNPLRYAFVDINITKSKMQQCMNLLSGSVWKGSTLRIAEAKSGFLDKLEQERKDAERAQKDAAENKKKPKKPKPGPSEPALTTAENAKERAGWKIDPATSTPIFPIIARPDHPLPPIPDESAAKADSKSKKRSRTTDDAKDAKADKKQKKDKKSESKDSSKKDAPADPPTRARRVKIDSTKWNPKHLREADLAGNGLAGKLVTSNDLKEVEEESAEGTSEDSDSDASQPDPTEVVTLPAFNEDETATERQKQMALLEQLLGRAPERISEGEAANGSSADLLEVEDEDEEESSSEAEAEEEPEVTAVKSTASTIDNGVIEESSEVSSDEEAADLEGGEAEVAEESSKDSEAEASQEDSASSEDDAAEDGDAAQSEAASYKVTSNQMQSLTEMFKPQEATAGFSLGAFLDDIELDEEDLDVPSEQPPTFHPTTRTHEQSFKAVTTSYNQLSSASGGYDPYETLFFPFPLEGDDLPGGIAYGLSAEEREKLLSRSWTGVSEAKRFKRTQTIDEITAQHETVRRKLNEQVRKRHREAVKRNKRTGGGRA